jgi:hypothetical protein
MDRVRIQGCQNRKNVPNEHEMYQMVIKISRMSGKIFRMAIKYINIFQSKAPKHFTQIGIFSLKKNIWQPCWGGVVNFSEAFLRAALNP